MEVLFQFIVPDPAFLFPVLLSYQIRESNVFPAILPSDHDILFCHQSYEFVFVFRYGPCVHGLDRDVENVGIRILPRSVFLQEVFIKGPAVGRCFGALPAVISLSFFRHGQTMLHAQFIIDPLHLFQVMFFPLEFMAVIDIDGIHDEMVMPVMLVRMGHDQDFKSFPCLHPLCQLQPDPVCFFRRAFTRREILCEMFIGPSAGFLP